MALLQAFPKGTYDKMFSGGAGDIFFEKGAVALIPAPLEIFQSSVGGAMAKAMILIAIVGQFFCGMCGVTANSRMVYAFSRDGALPGSKYWHRINPKTRTPTNAVWLGITLSAIAGALALIQSDNYAVAFFVLVGFCAVGLYMAYVIPVFLRLKSTTFKQGPWNLGKYSKIVGWTVVVYVACVNLMFLAPQFGPVSGFWPPWGGKSEIYGVAKVNQFNFTGPFLIILTIAIWAYWHLSAKNWFTGPKVMGTEEELKKIEAELAAVERGELPASVLYAEEDRMEAKHGGKK